MNFIGMIKKTLCILCLGTAVSAGSVMAMNPCGGRTPAAVIIEREVSSGRSVQYATAYANFIQRGFSEAKARKMVEIFESETRAGRSVQYAEKYAISRVEYVLDESEARRCTEVYVNELKEGKSAIYAEFYSIALVRGRTDEATARKSAEIFEQEVKAGRGAVYACEYSKLIACHGLPAESARRLADAAIREMKAGKSPVYIDQYIRLKVGQETGEERPMDEETIREIARIYADLVNQGVEPEQAERIAKAFLGIGGMVVAVDEEDENDIQDAVRIALNKDNKNR